MRDSDVARGIRRRSVFAAIASEGRRRRHGSVALRFVPSAAAGGATGLAFAIPRGVGNAVERNRIRRRARAAIVEHARRTGWRPTGAGVVSLRRSVLDQPFEGLVRDIGALLDWAARLPTGGPVAIDRHLAAAETEFSSTVAHDHAVSVDGPPVDEPGRPGPR